MFCENCGNEVQEDWVVCPKCGRRLAKPEMLAEESKNENGLEKTRETISKDESRMKMTLGTDTSSEVKVGISVRTILRILSIIALICFFCPLYMVSCSGEELAQVSGTDLTFGFECMGRELEGSLTYGAWGLLLVIGVVEAFAYQKRLESSGAYKEIKDYFYSSSACAGATVIWIWFFTAVLQKRAEGTLLEISPCMPLYIMGMVCAISVLVGGYQLYLLDLKEKENSEEIVEKVFSMIKCVFGVLWRSMLIFLVILFIDAQWGTGNLLEQGNKGTDGEQFMDYDLNDMEENSGLSGDAGEDVGVTDEGGRESQDASVESEYIFPESDKKYLTEEEVRSVTVEEMFIGRNEIYARHGYIFQSEELNTYFNNTSWYEGEVKSNWFNENVSFNDFEKKNVELIKRIEDEANGVSVQEEPFVIPMGTYVNDNVLSDIGYEGYQGLVMVSGVGENIVEVTILTMPEMSTMTLYGEKLDYKTIQVEEEYSGIVITLSWDSAREVTLTSSEEFEGMDADIFNKLANAHYTLAPGFW